MYFFEYYNGSYIKSNNNFSIVPFNNKKYFTNNQNTNNEVKSSEIKVILDTVVLLAIDNIKVYWAM